MIVDGRALAREILARVKARATNLPKPPRILAIAANETPSTRSYLSIKQRRAEEAGCVLTFIQMPDNTSTAALHAAVLSADADAVIVQLPLPAGVDTKAVCDAIQLEKDADVLSSSARERFEGGDTAALLPPVVGAVKEILMANNVGLDGKNAVVVGSGFLVGAPVATWLRQQGAEVVVVTSKSGNLKEALLNADIVVSGAGSPHLIKPDVLTQGVILIDAGTSESNGEVVGDADPTCAEKCSFFTPVPGGMGPLAVAKLFENAVTLAERSGVHFL
ncbi:hypothetical protein A3G63_02885 [Candidatus Kaiserbacteria bacterium RIFCSPLOWO2_12_FULL_52_8]|uniref:Methenyltetrahydrofolate cyclohydrolase n=1 Tax=Candidatus Kaiserbacteria bacterium RIFCSPHIGHO2_01_FULL_53_31 TaxID=1798481 RepID=A0A1F6CIE2_9BACT|nr:MAG: hypothetical protein A2678_02830 [Candidatus Kaiserbacteria bacterium RIFCSPHIGHO2_01_FULL_53_31]OGG94267.1 MAG: hypothetical protein A3G63_02885 [Candidatus Kaiserbacteria bacterium RIFCSPLOWO2_12_FULL_52_8]